MAYAARIQAPLISLFAALLAGGCAGQSGVGFPSLENDATSPADAATGMPTWTPLTESMLRNGTYRLPMYHRTVTLLEGVFSGMAGSDVLQVRMVESILMGDLNGDGADDAVVVLSENGGGTGVFVSLVAVLNDQGTPRQAASALIDDRPILQGMGLDAGAITVEAIIHGADEPMCCPEFPVIQTYRLSGDRLLVTRLDSKTPDGRLRLIRIQQSAEKPTSVGTVRIFGSVTIAPFENTLLYRWVDLAGNHLAEGYLTVSADSPGAPGTFESTIPVPTASTGQTLQLKILEPSAEDGSMLAMDSIFFPAVQ